MNIVSLLAGAAHRVDSVVGKTSWNVDDDGPNVAAEVHVGDTSTEFERFVAEEGWHSFVVQNTMDALVASVGLSVTRGHPVRRSVLADADIWCESLGTTIPARSVVGVIDGATFETREGPSFNFEMAGRLYREGEADYNEWVIRESRPSFGSGTTEFRRRSPRAHRSSTGSRM